MSKARISSDDSGFALVEALFAAALLALAGTVIALVGANLLRTQDNELRRSSALVTLDMMAKLLRTEGLSLSMLLPSEDENFRFELVYTEGASGASIPVRLEAHPKGSSVASYTLDLVLATDSQ